MVPQTASVGTHVLMEARRNTALLTANCTQADQRQLSPERMDATNFRYSNTLIKSKVGLALSF